MLTNNTEGGFCDLLLAAEDLGGELPFVLLTGVLDGESHRTRHVLVGLVFIVVLKIMVF